MKYWSLHVKQHLINQYKIDPDTSRTVEVKHQRNSKKIDPLHRTLIFDIPGMLLTYDVSQAITLDSYSKSPNLTSSFKLVDHWWGVVYQLVRDMLPVSILYKSYVRSRFGISHWRCGILNCTCVVIGAGEPYQVLKLSPFVWVRNVSVFI